MWKGINGMQEHASIFKLTLLIAGGGMIQEYCTLSDLVKIHLEPWCSLAAFCCNSSGTESNCGGDEHPWQSSSSYSLGLTIFRASLFPSDGNNVSFVSKRPLTWAKVIFETTPSSFRLMDFSGSGLSVSDFEPTSVISYPHLHDRTHRNLERQCQSLR